MCRVWMGWGCEGGHCEGCRAPTEPSLLVLLPFTPLQAAVNLLVVAPDSLLALVDGTLHISHRAALRYLALREDFRSARVCGSGDSGGTTLAALFSSE